MRACDRRFRERLRLRRASVVLLAALWMSLITAAGARAAAITFAPPVSIAQTGASGITAADFDADGNLDLAVGDIASGRLSLLYGRGDGSFEPPVDFHLDNGYQLALGSDHQMIGADVNGDGLPDLIVADSPPGQVLVFMNQGHRSFAPPVGYATGVGPLAITAADFDGDGALDLAVSNHGSSNLSVLLNRGDGTFRAAVSYPVGGNCGGISSADLNGDGKIDLVVSTIVGDSVVVYFGDGTGKFVWGGGYAVGASPGHVILDDFNGDGKLDVATPDWFGNAASVLFGDGGGKLSPAAGYTAGGYAGVMGAADFDSDGAPDLACALGGSPDVAVLRNLGNGTFAPPQLILTAGQNTRTLAVGDFNNDGLPDIAAGGQDSGTVSILLNNTALPSPAIRSLTLDTTAPVGGYQVINGTITLTAPAPAGGAVVTLTTNNPAVTVPPSVTVPAGQTTAGIVLGTTPVAAPQRGNLTASFNGTAKRLAVTVRAPAARFIVVAPNPFKGGGTATGKVVADVPAGPNGLVVPLASDHPDVVSLPATVTIPAGQTSVTFSFATSPVSAPVTVVVTAGGPGAVRSTTLQVLDLGVPLPPVDGAVTPPVYDPGNGHWYQFVHRSDRLTWPAARDLAAGLSYAGLPGHLATITSSAENQFVSRYMSASGPLGDIWIGGYQDHRAPDYSEPAGGWRWVTGEPWSYTSWSGGEPNNGAGGGEDALETNTGGTWNDLPPLAGVGAYLIEYEPPVVLPVAITVPALAAPAGPTAGGRTVTARLTLAQPAGPNGVVITLTSDQPAAVVVPPSVTVPPGQSSAGFTVTVYPVPVDTTVVLTVQGPGGTEWVPVAVPGLGLPLPAVSGTAAPLVFNPANGHWYQVVTPAGPVSWEQARDAAAALSYAGLPGHLATVTSAAENQFIWDNVTQHNPSQSDYLLGGYQDKRAPDYSEPAGGWRWVTGEPWNFTYWAAGEPNNGGGVEDVLGYWSPQLDHWNDFNPAPRVVPFIVEYEPPIAPLLTITLSPVPAPAGPTAGGQKVSGVVTLAQPAGPNPATIYLASDHPGAIALPATVTVPAGQFSAPFTATVYPVAADTPVVLTADGPTASATVTVPISGLGLPLPQVSGTAAPPVYDPANGHWYQEVQGPALTWAQARDAAAALSYAGLPGHLATLNSFNEGQFILNNVPDAQDGSTQWIGGYQDRFAPDYAEPAGGWRWVTGEPWSYTNWNGGEPNNAGGVEDFLQWLPPGNWNDLSGGATITGYLVEYEPTIPRLAPTQVTLSPNPVTGGQGTTGTVTLTQPAGPNGLTVSLNSDHPLIAAVPPSVQIPAGQSAAGFAVTTNLVSAPTIVQITADAPMGSAAAPLTVNDTGVPLPAVDGDTAPPVYNPANGHWYQEVHGPSLTWAQARDAAAALTYAGLPGHLATVTSSDEDQFILNNVPNAQSDTTHWIGGYQDRFAPDYAEPAGGWRWVTGEPWNYTNWNGGEPNNAGGVEDFLQWFSPGVWNDLSAAATITAYLVEYEPAIPRIAPSQVTLSPNPVTGGQGTTGTVTLAQPAGPNGLTVYLNSDHPLIAVVPPSVQVPAGQSAAGFAVTTSLVAAPTVVQITADAPAGSAAAPLTVNDTGVPLPQVDGNAAPPVYNPASGHWYQEVQGPALTWAQARDAAAALSYAGLPGHLATINSADEDQFILSSVPNAQSGSTHWIGGYQDRLAPDYSEPTGGWRWVTGEPWGYTNWNGGEPNNAGGIEDFLQWLSPGNWNDLPGSATITAYLVEYEPPIPQFTVSQVTIAPNPVTGGQTATGTVTLSQAAGSGGIRVFLGSGQPDVATVPPTVTVPAGQTTAAFTVTTNPVSVPTPVVIGASGPTGSASVSLQVVDSGAPLPQVSGALEPPVYNPANGHWYQEVSVAGGLTWAQARAAAAGVSYAGDPGHLVTVTSAAEHQFLLTHLPNSTECWIGLYQDRTAPDYSEPAGGWRWITGEPYAWNDWRGEPNNANGNEDFAVMRGDVGWNDLAATNLDNGYIIEYEAPPVPPAAPTTLAIATASPAQLNLSWTDNSDNETGFEIQRKTAGGDWTKIVVAAADAQTFSDTGLARFTHYTYRVRATNGAGASAWSNEAAGDTGTRGQMSLSPSGSLDFGSQALGTPSVAQTLTLTNSGNGPLAISGIDLSGSAVPPVTTGAALPGSKPGEFAISPAMAMPHTLAPGESLAVSFVFTPAALGPRSAVLSITSDAPGSPATVALTGSGSGPVAALSPTALDFGPEPMGLGTSLAVLLQNRGNAPLDVSSIAFQGTNAGDFSLATDGVTGHTLQPGDIVLLNVRFSPTATGSRSASLVITDDAAGSPRSISLTGTGTAPLLRLSADSLVFGLQSGSGPQTLKLTNNGDAPLQIDGLTLGGPDAGSFQIVSDTGEKSLPVGASRTVQIAFQTAMVARARRPARLAHIAGASYSATLQIKDNDPHPTSPHTVALIASSSASSADSTPPPPPPGFTPAGGSTPPAPGSPAAPGSLTATVTAGPQVTLTWSNATPDAHAYLTIWRQAAGGEWTRVALLPGDATHFTDTTALPGTTYLYHAHLVSGAAVSPWSNTASASTIGTTAAAPGALTATMVAGPQIRLTWSNRHPDPHAYLTVWRQEGTGAWTRVALLPGDATSFTDINVSVNTSYAYQAHWVNGPVVSPWSNLAHASTAGAALAPPSGLTATIGSGPQVRLTWSLPAPNPHAYLTVWRQAAGGEWTRVALLRGDARQFTDTNVQPGTSYSYHAHLVTDAAVSAWSNTATVSTPTAGPAQLTATAGPGAQVRLTWSNPHPDAHAWLTVWRQAGSGAWTRVALLHGDAASFTDTQVSAGTSYRYRAHRVDGADVSDWSNEATAVLP